jgi:hypothetical protein
MLFSDTKLIIKVDWSSMGTFSKKNSNIDRNKRKGYSNKRLLEKKILKFQVLKYKLFILSGIITFPSIEQYSIDLLSSI